MRETDRQTERIYERETERGWGERQTESERERGGRETE